MFLNKSLTNEQRFNKKIVEKSFEKLTTLS